MSEKEKETERKLEDVKMNKISTNTQQNSNNCILIHHLNKYIFNVR